MTEDDCINNRTFGSRWRVPRTDAVLVHSRLREKLLEAVSLVLFGDPWKAFQLVHDFERQFEAEMGYRFVSAVQSGSAGLRLSLLACGVKPGDEIITVANSDVATTASISHCGAVPVLCDVLASDYTMNPELVESLITERTVGLLPVDLHGHTADVCRLREIADRHGLFIVEDAALATGARDHDQAVGHFADMTVFSCSPYKPFEGIAYGGLIVTEDEALWERVAWLKGHGFHPGISESLPARYDAVVEGFNLDMAPINAAVLAVKLPNLKQWSSQRQAVGDWYKERLEDIGGVKLPSFRAESQPVFRTYTVRVRERDLVYRRLREGGVQAALHFVPPIHLTPAYRDRELPGRDRLHVTEEIADETLSLPVHPGLNLEQVDYACNLLSRILESAGVAQRVRDS